MRDVNINPKEMIMKRSILLAMALLLVFCGYSIAAESVTATVSSPGRWTNGFSVYVSFVTAANGSVTDIMLNDITGVPARNNFSGWFLDTIEYVVGTEAPTNESDLVLYRSATLQVDILEGEGSGLIDDTTNDSISVEKNLSGAEVISISNNSVDSAEFTLIFHMYRW